jgi:hypothetical protein
LLRRWQSLSWSRNSKPFKKSEPSEHTPRSHKISLQDILIRVILPFTSRSPKCVFSCSVFSD